MSTAQLEGLWQYIQTLSLNKTNRQWLAEHLLMDEETKSPSYYESEAFLRDLDAAEADIAQGKGTVVASAADLDALFV